MFVLKTLNAEIVLRPHLWLLLSQSKTGWWLIASQQRRAVKRNTHHHTPNSLKCLNSSAVKGTNPLKTRVVPEQEGEIKINS